MKPTMTMLLVSGTLLAAAAAPAAAQSRAYVGFGTGLSLPTGKFATGNKLGWLGQFVAGITSADGRLGGRIDAGYSRHSLKRATGRTGLFGVNGDVVLNLGDQSADARPYLLGGLGFYNVKSSITSGSTTVKTSATKVAFNFGAGLTIRATDNMAMYMEARFVSVRAAGGAINFIPLSVGLRWGGLP